MRSWAVTARPLEHLTHLNAKVLSGNHGLGKGTIIIPAQFSFSCMPIPVLSFSVVYSRCPATIFLLAACVDTPSRSAVKRDLFRPSLCSRSSSSILAPHVISIVFSVNKYLTINTLVPPFLAPRRRLIFQPCAPRTLSEKLHKILRKTWTSQTLRWKPPENQNRCCSDEFLV